MTVEEAKRLCVGEHVVDDWQQDEPIAEIISKEVETITLHWKTGKLSNTNEKRPYINFLGFRVIQ